MGGLSLRPPLRKSFPQPRPTPNPRSLAASPPTPARETSTGGADKSGSGGAVKTPPDFLKSIRGRPVVVMLNSVVDYRGILACLDGYMNTATEQTEDFIHQHFKFEADSMDGA